jgi:UDP-N-acetylglucosamine--N-acetylmuramyl-(pentapeptide) pyrophosphoryl-undecaprenol N-acetylglucosamine transferase
MSCMMIMAGGTGGHVYPALAVARLLRASGVRIVWLGTRSGMEATVVPNAGFDIEWISIRGLRGNGPVGWLLAPIRLFRAMWQSMRVFREIRPQAVLGMGGFVSGPGGVVAKLLRYPLVLHEQNASAGLTNRILAVIADRVLTGFPSVPELPPRSEWVGNPVRKDIAGATRPSPGTTTRILITGGSQGAMSLNRLLPEAIREIQQDEEVKEEIEVWHQSGRGKADELAECYKQAGVEARVSEFIEDMGSAYRWADFVVCRAGAMTVAELCAAGLPAILVPYPYAVGDHQAANAGLMVDRDAGVMLREEGLDSGLLAQAMTGILASRTILARMGENSKSLYKANAAERVAAICLEYLQPGIAHA